MKETDIAIVAFGLSFTISVKVFKRSYAKFLIVLNINKYYVIKLGNSAATT